MKNSGRESEAKIRLRSMTPRRMYRIILILI